MIPFLIPVYELIRLSTSNTKPDNDWEYNDIAVWILWGCDHTLPL